MKRFIGIAAAATLLAAPAAFAQQQAQQPNQIITQEQSQGSGAALRLSPATVREIQQQLNAQGYNAGAVDGNVGQQTTRALRNFQQAQGLEPTGNFDTNTLSALGVNLSGISGGQPGGSGMQSGQQSQGGQQSGQQSQGGQQQSGGQQQAQ